MSRFTTLYRGETDIQFISSRKKWYAASAVLILICVISFVFRGFDYGIDFKGGSTFIITGLKNDVSVSEVADAFDKAGVASEGSPQKVGTDNTIVVNTKTLGPKDLQDVQKTVAADLGISAKKNISPKSIGSDWGHDTTIKALQGLIIFLVVVSIYIALRFQWRMAVGGMVALLHDLIIAAGVYSIVGFQVTPSTIVGLLTILGFSLYDTVVVYDKVGENAKDILAGSRTTFSEAANKAVNQTLMRSINTSVIALLPVAGLLFVGAGILGVGTIEDLALILFVGLLSGAYSSLFLATPVVVDLTERDPQYKALTKRVAAKRASEARKAEEGGLVGVGSSVNVRRGAPAPAPKVGARPNRRKRT
ncbi:protein translocase subunit SecF [uncultured Jatrophihabitans sp.]|uniref:protein translocase subunit SecF n=1 Tax=uncultured Jatrophihabitans sp. TaxID=1610747 RepID=UPI0035CB45FE